MVKNPQIRFDELMVSAKSASERAYAPYSGYRVGSAILTDKGIFNGFNIENASLPAGVCAEMAGIISAKIGGAERIFAMAVYCADASEPEGSPERMAETMPCGICRQWLAEHAPTAVIKTNGSAQEFQLEDLMPRPFNLPGKY